MITRIRQSVFPVFLLVCCISLGAVSAQAQSTPGTSTAITCPGTQLTYPRQEPIYNSKRVRDLSAFSNELKNFASKAEAIEKLVAGKTIPELQQLMKQGKLSSEELVLHYIHRIQLYDIDKLNSVMELNPDALIIARAKDAERRSGKAMGLMQGIPVLLKDNIATADKMHTTAGAVAMMKWKPSKDAFLAGQLRKAGAIILGKANLSEWANYMDPCMPSGFSTNGGQTRNPYGPYDTWGSSSGSAVSVAADLTTVSVGSETQGSIIMPAGINSVVGLKTSMGLVSRSMVIPLLGFQDVPGPMGRTVTDVAVLLTALTGYDALDNATKDATPMAKTDFTKFLKIEFVKTLKLGLPVFAEKDIDAALKELAGKTDSASMQGRNIILGIVESAKQEKKIFTDAGITVVEIPQLALPSGLDVEKALEFGFKEDLNAFLKQLGNAAPYPDLKAIIEYNKQDLKNRAPYGQKYLEMAQQTPITKAQYDSIRISNIASAKAGIDNLMKKYGVDVMMSSMGQAYAPAGYPALTIPVGYDENGSPESAVLVGTYLSEPKLLAIGYVLEQSIKARKNPNLEKTIKVIGEIKRVNY